MMVGDTLGWILSLEGNSNSTLGKLNERTIMQTIVV